MMRRLIILSKEHFQKVPFSGYLISIVAAASLFMFSRWSTITVQRHENADWIWFLKIFSILLVMEVVGFLIARLSSSIKINSTFQLILGAILGTCMASQLYLLILYAIKIM